MIRIINDIKQSITVMHNAASWLEESGLKPGQWWQPKNMNQGFLLKHTEPDEYRVAMIGDQAAASMILQDSERNQSWKSVDGDQPQPALYLHWLAVHRDFANQGLSKVMIDFAKKEAKNKGFDKLRLDTDADIKKLCDLYEGFGFKLMGIEKNGSERTAFYQIEI